MRRSIVALVACAAALAAPGRAQAQHFLCSDNCFGTNMGGDNPWMGLPFQPPGPPGEPPNRAGNRFEREQFTAGKMTRAGLAALEAGQAASPRSAASVGALLTTRDSSLAANGLRLALDGTRWEPSAVRNPTLAVREAPATNAAQQAQAARVARLLNGLLVEGQKPRKLFARVTKATRAFNQLVAVASPKYLSDPPREFLLVHEVLAHMMTGEASAPPPPARQNVSVWVVTPTTPTGLTRMTAVYDRANGDTTIVVNGTTTPLRSAFAGVPTALGASWYIQGRPLVLNTGRGALQYISFGTLQRIDPSYLAYVGTVNGLAVFASKSDVADLTLPTPPIEIGTNPALLQALRDVQVLYVPATPYGALFQPMQLQGLVRKVRGR